MTEQVPCGGDKVKVWEGPTVGGEGWMGTGGWACSMHNAHRQRNLRHLEVTSLYLRPTLRSCSHTLEILFFSCHQGVELQEAYHNTQINLSEGEAGKS